MHSKLSGTVYLIWGSQALSVLGSSVMFFAMNVWMVQVLYPQGGEGLSHALMLSALVFMVPALLLGPFGGILADRFNRGRVMLFCDLLGGGVALLLALLLLGGWLSLSLYLLLGLLLGTCATVHGVAYSALPALLSNFPGSMPCFVPPGRWPTCWGRWWGA